MASLSFLISLLLALSYCSAANIAPPRGPRSAGYTLKYNFDSTNWFDSFIYKTEGDPTNGFVDYTGLDLAKTLGLTKIVNKQVYLGVDNTNIIPQGSRGRRSIWLTSKIEFTHGLLIGDFAHMPASDCGTWPAFWTIREGHGYPNPSSLPYGEIDIIETFNDHTNGYITLHTDTKASSPDCSFTQTKPFQTGELNQGFTSCKAQPGCSTVGPDGSTGTPFNAQGGGVYAMSWTRQFINVYYFPRGKIPKDITDGKPNPNGWGTPVASFDESRGKCDIEANFPAQTISLILTDLNRYFDTTFCGNSAGGLGWTDWTDCSVKTKTATCEDWVRNNPHAFDNVYWLINSVKVYQH